MNRTVNKLFQLAKVGQKEQFLSLIQQNNVLGKINYLNGKELSQLIYAYQKLKLLDNELQNKFEQAYLDSSHKMNIYDHVMCGWSFKNRLNNQIQQVLLESINKNLSKIHDMQQERANIGLIAYLAAQENDPKNPLWARVNSIFQETMEYQDEKNFMMLLYAFSKIQPENQDIWIQLEKYVWGKRFQMFSYRNKILMVYSFAKAGKGSIQFWDSATSCISKLQFQSSDDISFCVWSFCRMNIKQAEFWQKILDQQIQFWNQASLADIENVTWALEKLQISNKEFWDKLLNQKISNQQSVSAKYNEFDEIVTIGKRLYDLNFQDSIFFLSLKDRILNMLDRNQIDFSITTRLHYLKIFISKDSLFLDEKLVKQFIQSIKNLKTKKIYNVKFINSLTIMMQEVQIQNEQLKKELLTEIQLYYQQIKFIDIKNNIDQQCYFWIGQSLVQYSESQILPLIMNDQIYQSAINNIDHLCNIIKILSQYNNTQQFFNNLRTYKSTKPDVFMSLFFNMIHKYNYLVPKESYKFMKNLLKSRFQNQDQQEIQNQFINLIINKSDNFISDINKLMQMDIQDYIKQYSNTNQLDEQMQQQALISKERLEFQQQLDLKNQEFIDIVHASAKHKLEENFNP